MEINQSITESGSKGASMAMVCSFIQTKMFTLGSGLQAESKAKELMFSM